MGSGLITANYSQLKAWSCFCLCSRAQLWWGAEQEDSPLSFDFSSACEGVVGMGLIMLPQLGPFVVLGE
jgi:hypothetical protein